MNPISILVHTETSTCDWQADIGHIVIWLHLSIWWGIGNEKCLYSELGIIRLCYSKSYSSKEQEESLKNGLKHHRSSPIVSPMRNYCLRDRKQLHKIRENVSDLAGVKVSWHPSSVCYTFLFPQSFTGPCIKGKKKKKIKGGNKSLFWHGPLFYGLRSALFFSISTLRFFWSEVSIWLAWTRWNCCLYESKS